MNVRRTGFAFTACALALSVAPWVTHAQPVPPTVPPTQPAQPQPAQPVPPQSVTVAVLPFTGRATQDLLLDAENVVRAALSARGSTVPDRVAVGMMLGVSAPSDPQSIVGFGRSLRATHVLTGSVTPLTGQYNVHLTLYEVANGRSARQEGNVGDDNVREVVAQMVAALFDPAAMGPPPVDPEEQRRQEEERRRQEEQRRQEEERRRQDEARRRADEARRRQDAFNRNNPERRIDDAGPVGLGAGLTFGGVLSGSDTTGNGLPRNRSSFASALRVEVSYALRGVAGLELTGNVLWMFAPSTALGLGAGAQYTFPAVTRGRFRGTAGALIGLFQGISGAQITTVWFEPFARFEVSITPGATAYAGLTLDVAPGDNGGVTALSALVGVRFRLGGESGPVTR